MIAAKTGAPVVPVKLVGSYEALPKSGLIARPVAVVAKVGRSLNLDLRGAEDRRCYQQVSDKILAAIERI